MRRAATLLLTASLVLAACSSDDPAMDASPSPTATQSDTVSPTATDSETDPALPTEGPSTEASASETGAAPGTEADIALTADLTGAVEVPGPGDPTGSGSFSATVVMNEAAGELCYQLEVAALSSEVTAAHIHAAPSGESGPVHIGLTPPIGGPVDECQMINATELLPLLDDPTQFYVNVHTQGHPDGAVRGQLEEQ